MAQPTDIPASEVLTVICDEQPHGLGQVCTNGGWALQAAAEAVGCAPDALTVHRLIHLLHRARRREATGFDDLNADRRKKATSVLTRLSAHALWMSMIRPLAEFPEEARFPEVHRDMDGIEDPWAMKARTVLRLLFTLIFGKATCKGS